MWLALIALGLLAYAPASFAVTASELESARNRQDQVTLERIARELAASAAGNPSDAVGWSREAQAWSYLAEVALELRDKKKAADAAESGIRAAENATARAPKIAEYHRLLGTLCGQVIPANVMSALRYGKCATAEIEKAIELDPRSSLAYLSRGVGKYYLPPSFGGSIEGSLQDIRKAIELNPKESSAYMWLGIVLRKANQNRDARKAFQQAIKLNPERVWFREQLEKTPAQ